VNHRLAGRKIEVSVAADASRSLTVEYTVFIKKIPYESAVGHRVKSRFRKPVGIVDFRNLNEQHLHDLGKSWILESDGAVVLGHTDSSNHSEHSTPEVVW
jgi:hypothetical protein